MVPSRRLTTCQLRWPNYVLPLLFLRYLSLRYEQRRQELKRLVDKPDSEYYVQDKQLAEEIAEYLVEDPDEYRKVNIFLLPEEATWDYIRRNARADDIRIKLDRAMERLEDMYPQLRGVLPKIYAGSDTSDLLTPQTGLDQTTSPASSWNVALSPRAPTYGPGEGPQTFPRGFSDYVRGYIPPSK